MIIELEMLQAKLAKLPDFPPELKTLLEHLIISHHGQYDFGSPKLPMFPEALMLHYLDDLDSKMEAMRAHFEREAGLEGPVDELQRVARTSAARMRGNLSREKKRRPRNRYRPSEEPESTRHRPLLRKNRRTRSATTIDLFSEQKA